MDRSCALASKCTQDGCFHPPRQEHPPEYRWGYMVQPGPAQWQDGVLTFAKNERSLHVTTVQIENVFVELSQL